MDAPSEFLQPAAHGRAGKWRYRRVPDERGAHCSHLTPSFGDVCPEVLILALLPLTAYLQPQEQSGFSLWDFGAQFLSRDKGRRTAHTAPAEVFITSEVLAETKKAIFYTLNEHN